MKKESNLDIKNIEKLINKSRNDHKKLVEDQKDILQHTEFLIDELSNPNLDMSRKTQLKKELFNLKDMLREIQFIDEMEFESEKLITKINMHDSTKATDIDSEWEKMFKLLENYMQEKGHCYFEPPKKNNSGNLVYSKYRGASLAKWVEEQRMLLPRSHNVYLQDLASIRKKNREKFGRGRSTLPILAGSDIEKYNKLCRLTIEDEIKIKYARDHLAILQIMADGEYVDEVVWDLSNKPPKDQLTADFTSYHLNHVQFLWSNADASWMRYFKELKKFYARNLHCMVQAKEISNGLELGTWVLRQRQEWKAAKKKRHENYGVHPQGAALCGYIERDILLYNLFFIFETNMSETLDIFERKEEDAIKKSLARKDILDLGKRVQLYENGLELIDSGEKH